MKFIYVGVRAREDSHNEIFVGVRTPGAHGIGACDNYCVLNVVHVARTELNLFRTATSSAVQLSSVQYLRHERVHHKPNQFVTAVANQYEVGRCDVSLVLNSDPCIYRYIPFSLKMENEKCNMNIH